MKIGFLGFGEAAYEMSRGLKSEGLKDIFAYDVMRTDPRRGILVNERLVAAGVTAVDSVRELVERCDSVFALVPCSVTLECARQAAAFLKKGQLYADFSASVPQTKADAAQIVQSAGADFADGAILGSLPRSQHKVDILASGQGAQRLASDMTAYHMNITVCGAAAGDASAIKLARSVFMKGLGAVCNETLEAARALGVEKEVLSSIFSSMDADNFEQMFNRFITGSRIHAKRRSDELLGVLELLEQKGLPSFMTCAAYETHKALIEDGVKR